MKPVLLEFLLSTFSTANKIFHNLIFAWLIPTRVHKKSNFSFSKKKPISHKTPTSNNQLLIKQYLQDSRKYKKCLHPITWKQGKGTYLIYQLQIQAA